MLTYTGGSSAKGGFYLKKGEWEIITLDGKNGTLPGGTDCQYIRLPALLFVPAAIMLSVPFVIFLPFIGFAMAFVVIMMKLGQGVAALGRGLAENFAEWRAAVEETADELVAEIEEELAPEPVPKLATIGSQERVTEANEDSATDDVEGLARQEREDAQHVHHAA